MILGSAEPLSGTVRVSFVGVGGSGGVMGALIVADTAAVALGSVSSSGVPPSRLEADECSEDVCVWGVHFGSCWECVSLNSVIECLSDSVALVNEHVTKP